MKKSALDKGSLPAQPQDPHGVGISVPGDFFVAKQELMSSGETILWRDAAKLDMSNPLREYVLHHPRALGYGLPAPTEDNPRFIGVRSDGTLLIRQGDKEIIDTALTPQRPATLSLIPGYSDDFLYPN